MEAVAFDDIYTVFRVASYNDHYNYRLVKKILKTKIQGCNCTSLHLPADAHNCSIVKLMSRCHGRPFQVDTVFKLIGQDLGLL